MPLNSQKAHIALLQQNREGAVLRFQTGLRNTALLAVSMMAIVHLKRSVENPEE